MKDVIEWVIILAIAFSPYVFLVIEDRKRRSRLKNWRDGA